MGGGQEVPVVPNVLLTLAQFLKIRYILHFLRYVARFRQKIINTERKNDKLLGNSFRKREILKYEYCF